MTFPSFLRNLHAQHLENWLLLVVDNNVGGDKTAEQLVQNDHRVQLIRNNANLGFACGVNQGLRAGLDLGAPLLVLINNDVSFAPDFLEVLLAARDRLGADVIAPRVMHSSHPDKVWYAGGHFDYGVFFENKHEMMFEPNGPPVSRQVDFASGCCLGLTPAAVQRVGLLDERFFVYWEDADYSLRLNKAGIPIFYVSEPFLLHDGNSSTDGAWSPTHLSLYYCSYMHLLRKHFGYFYAVRTAMLLMLRQLKWCDKGMRQLASMTGALLKGLRQSATSKIQASDPEGSVTPGAIMQLATSAGKPDLATTPVVTES